MKLPYIRLTLVLAFVFLLSPDNAFAQDSSDDSDSAPDVIFISYPAEVKKGKKVTLEWSSDGDYCNASGGWTGRRETSGTATVTIKKNHKFSLQCFTDEGAGSAVASTKVTVVKKVKKTARPIVEQFGWYDGAGNGIAVVAPGMIGTIRWSAKNAIACKASSMNEDWTGLLPSSGELDVTASDNDVFSLKCLNRDGVTPPASVIRVETPVSFTPADILKNIVFTAPKGITMLQQDPYAPDWQNGAIAQGTQSQITVDAKWIGSAPVKRLALWEVPFSFNFPDYSASQQSPNGIIIEGSVSTISPGALFNWQWDGSFISKGTKTLTFTLGDKTLTRTIKVQECTVAKPGDLVFASCTD